MTISENKPAGADDLSQASFLSVKGSRVQSWAPSVEANSPPCGRLESVSFFNESRLHPAHFGVHPAVTAPTGTGFAPQP